MAQLYFKYGAMGSSKSANALMARFNYEERGQKALMVKPRLDARDGEHMVYSRIGLKYPCVYFDEMQEMTAMELQQNACIIVDEAQFLTKEEVMYLVDLVDRLDIPVLCYGLRADFKGDLFPGSYQLLVMADKIEEVKTICWCGKKATFNARFDENGKVLKEGEQVVLGANDKYIGLCRRHWMEGNLGPDFDLEALWPAPSALETAGGRGRRTAPAASAASPRPPSSPGPCSTSGRSPASSGSTGREPFFSPAAISAAPTARISPSPRAAWGSPFPSPASGKSSGSSSPEGRPAWTW